MNGFKKEFLNFECCIFDLDNTLFCETDYLFAAYKSIGRFVYNKYGLSADLIKNYLILTFKQRGRNKLFNLLINNFQLEQADLIIFLEILRNQKLDDKLLLYNKMEQLLIYLNLHNIPIFIITNGNVQQQKNKISQINWNNIKYKEVVYANLFTPKPSSESIDYVAHKYKFSLEKIVFIGDSSIDNECAKNANVSFINVDQLIVN